MLPLTEKFQEGLFVAQLQEMSEFKKEGRAEELW
jgi:hypothetical protein